MHRQPLDARWNIWASDASALSAQRWLKLTTRPVPQSLKWSCVPSLVVIVLMALGALDQLCLRIQRAALSNRYAVPLDTRLNEELKTNGEQFHRVSEMNRVTRGDLGGLAHRFTQGRMGVDRPLNVLKR